MQNVSVISSLSAASVPGVLLHWKPASAWNSEADFPVNFNLLYGIGERRNEDGRLLRRFRLLKIFLETGLRFYLEIAAIFLRIIP
jgi:hypothetical protein